MHQMTTALIIFLQQHAPNRVSSWFSGFLSPPKKMPGDKLSIYICACPVFLIECHHDPDQDKAVNEREHAVVHWI